MAEPSPVAVVDLAPLRGGHLGQVLRVEESASARPWSRAAFVTELSRQDRRYLVATDPGESGDRVVGFAGAALLGDAAHVMTIAVAPAQQGRGVGARLLDGLLAEVVGAGLRAATLEVRTSNVAARRLYRRAGFTEAGVRPAYYPDGEDAVIMWHHDLGQEG